MFVYPQTGQRNVVADAAWKRGQVENFKIELLGIGRCACENTDFGDAGDERKSTSWLLSDCYEAYREHCQKNRGVKFHWLTSRTGHRTRFYLTNFVEALAEALLEALIGGLIVRAADEIVGEAGHVCPFIIEIVGVFVALAIADVFHQSRDGVANVERHRFGFGFVNVIDDFAVSSVNGVRFWREREIDGGLS